MKVLSLFSGIGAFEKALQNIKYPYDVVNYCEIDKYASKAYSLIHNIDEGFNLGDITKIDTESIPDCDLATYGFPCQSISQAGKQEGFFDKDGNVTRSGLFFEALRIIKAKQPKIAICENVKALTSKKFVNEFKIVLESLEKAGYNNYWQILNARDYGIPQNRERIFIVSIRKDIDEGVIFPPKQQLNIVLKDLLETTVDTKYYLKDERIKKLKLSTPDISYCLDANYYKGTTIEQYEKKHRRQLVFEEPQIEQIGKLRSSNSQGDRVYSQTGLSPSILTGSDKLPKIIIYDDYNNRVRKYQECIGTITTRIGSGSVQNGIKLIAQEPVCAASRGRNPENLSDRTPGNPTKQHLELKADGCSNTITTVQKDNYIIEPPFKVRRLTPKECWRLMGFDDEDIEVCAKNGISDTQLYKMAGNSIVVNVLEALFLELFKIYNL